MNRPTEIEVVNEFADEERIGGEILSAVGSKDGLFLSSIGALDPSLDRHSSVIEARSYSGERLWSVEDTRIGAGPVTKTRSAVIASGYRGVPTSPVLRAFDLNTGELEWPGFLLMAPDKACVR